MSRDPPNERVFVHVDCDCFYAQVETLRNPELEHVPLGVTQKYLVVTCNYKARERGVTKLMGISEAKRLCPELVCVNGEDLTPYKDVSDRILDVLSMYGRSKRLGSDEMCVDVTEEVGRRIRAGFSGGRNDDVCVGHIFVPDEDSYHIDSIHRVMDLRANGKTGRADRPVKGCSRLLTVGSWVAADIRRIIKSMTGIRTSAGISHTQLISKLISGLHKPDDQTILLPEHVEEFLGPLHVRVIPGVGAVLHSKLQEAGIIHVRDLWGWSRARLVDRFGERQGSFLHLASKGLDHVPLIQGDTEPKSISVEDSFKECRGFVDALRIVNKLAPDLALRLQKHCNKFRKLPGNLTVTWRLKESGLLARQSASCSINVAKSFDSPYLAEIAYGVLKGKLQQPFHLNLLCLTAKNFKTDDAGEMHPQKIRSYLKSNRSSASQRHASSGGEAFAPTVHSKHDLRRLREAGHLNFGDSAARETMRCMDHCSGFWKDLQDADGLDEDAHAVRVQAHRDFSNPKRKASYLNDDAMALIKTLQSGNMLSSAQDCGDDQESLKMAMQLQQEEYDLAQSIDRARQPKRKMTDFFKRKS